MPLLENIVQGFAGAAGNEGVVNQIQKNKDARATLSKDELEQNSKQILSGVQNLQGQIAGLDKNSPTYQADFDKLQGALSKHQEALRDLYHPEKNPGALQHLAGFVRSHIGMKPLEPTKSNEVTPKRLTDLAASAPGVPEKGDQNTYLKKKQDLKAAFPNLSDADVERLVTGGKAEEKWKPNGAPFKLPTGGWGRLEASPTGEMRTVAMPAEWQPSPAQQKLTQTQSSFARWLKDKGKTLEQGTSADEQAFNTEMYGSKNPYARKRLAISEVNLALREAEGDMKDYLAVQKQLLPLTKIQATADRADDYVKSPSGPGDIALTLAFVEAVKPSSGFRFTDVERQWILQSRGLIEGAEAKINSGYNGTVLSPEQRENMAAIIRDAAAKTEETGQPLVDATRKINPRVGKLISSPAEAKKAAAPKPTGKAVSLAAAKKLPRNQGKTDDEVREDIEAHGHKVTD